MKHLMPFVTIVFFYTFFVGCSSTSDVKSQPSFQKSEVIERVGSFEETPEWTTGVKPFSLEKGDFVYISTMTMSGDSRPEACVRASANMARANILREIKDNLSVSGQLNASSATSDPDMEDFLVYVSQRSLTGVKVKEAYWEKRVESDTDGERILKLQCATKVAISKKFLNEQISEARNVVGAKDPEVRNKLKESHMNFIERSTSAE